MNIFDYLNDILFTKKGNKMTNVDDESDFNQFMINRWCSMYSPNMAVIINSTTNRLHSIFTTKNDFYKFVSTILPRVKFKRIHYIKKNKSNENADEFKNVDLLAKRLEISEREIKSYYEFQSSCTRRASESTG